jgi:hypothetical protein
MQTEIALAAMQQKRHDVTMKKQLDVQEMLERPRP